MTTIPSIVNPLSTTRDSVIPLHFNNRPYITLAHKFRTHQNLA